ncbi:hypothetical protein [Chitinophaga solisilvae]|uniref:hypothetical protein n=1 Tax=Chitinophaga solisilvae TaxID=1233460 RepID=UPI001370E63F|nr:hypothetical protein [Chitinophaga solisilvae]
MNIHRRSFLRNASLATGLLLIEKPLRAAAGLAENAQIISGSSNALIIRHTNDLHGILRSRLYENGAGLLLDAGDFLDDNHSVAQQRATIQAMNQAGYHAATIGNRELSNGQEQLAALLPDMKFPLVNCNYRFTNATLTQHVRPYVIVYAGPYKVGITGAGPELKEVKGVTCLPAVETANQTARHLKTVMGCDFVICLSHLGFVQKGDVADNKTMATASSHINFVIGGHQDTLIPSTMVYRNELHQEVYLSQAGKDGRAMGQLTFHYNDERQAIGIAPHIILS